MKRLLASVLLLFGVATAHAELKVGDKAPEFSGVDNKGVVISSQSLKGHKYVIYFYPKDDTPGCTKQACSFRDNYEKLMSDGFQVIGVSADDKASHDKFAAKYDLPFPLIADTDKKIIKAFGVSGLFTQRKTFVVNAEGVITKIIEDTTPKEHAFEVLKP